MAKSEQQESVAETKTPHEWAVTLGKYRAVSKFQPQLRAHYSPDHAAADELHGWTRFAYNYQAAGETFTLSETDYRAALDAALHYPVKPAHAAAIPRKVN